MVRYRQEFDRELEAIEAQVMKLFAMVAEDLRGATQALLSGDNEVLRELAEREQVIEGPVPGDRAAGQPGDLAPSAGGVRPALLAHRAAESSPISNVPTTSS